MNATAHPAAERYLKELDRALTDLPRDRRHEIVNEIRGHIDEATPPGVGDAQVRNVLEELGDPQTIAADARERLGITSNRGGAVEGAAILLLLIGGFIIPLPMRPFILPGIGWLAGVVLLWISPVWKTREKVIGTLIVPGGLALPYFLRFVSIGGEVCEAVESRPGRRPRLDVSTCYSTGPEPWMMAIVIGLLVVASIATAIYLGRKAWRPSPSG
ncbi:MAG: DUF1700 domain-containing protein [Actinomycetota bacterium]|nr:DUF1700 domain-containing protein [Actinomycetota bacterium]